ncbi:MAG: rhomboid family intramembrane serine protease [Fimbriimonas sp.]|nr:rhomboid family intramembrane serine protease [Fimbriimonas sp.]
MSVRTRLPIVTLLLIAANIVAAFCLLVNPDLAVQLGFRPNHPSLVGAFTSLFLHANVLHLLGNMVFLAAVGVAVELATGSLRFVIVYFAGGLIGILTHFLITRHAADPSPLIGASGCIAGCAAYYSVRYTRLRVALAPKLAMSVAAVTGIWLGLQIVGAFVRIGESGGIAFWAHIGGFAAGALLSVVFRAPDLEQVKLGHEVLDRMNSRGPGAAEFAAKEHLAKHPNDLKALWDLANAQQSQGEIREEAQTLLQIVGQSTESDQVEAVRRLCQSGHASLLPAIRRLQIADRCHIEAPAIERALLRSVVEGPVSDPQRPDAILAFVSIERESQPDVAQGLLADLVKNYPLHPAVDLAQKRGWLA